MKIRAKKPPPHCPEIRSWSLLLATPQRNVDPASHMPLWPEAKSHSRNFRFSIPFILNNSRHRHAKAPPKPLTPPVTLRLETGKDIDHRTNTTVSRPGQFRVALRILWSSPADGFFSRVGDGPVGTGFSRSNDGRTSGASSSECAPARRGARILACRVAIRGDIVPTLMSAPAPVRANYGEEDHPLAAVFALLLRAAVEVRSTGARGASQKKKRQMQRTTRKHARNGTDHGVYPTQMGGTLPRSEPKKSRTITNE